MRSIPSTPGSSIAATYRLADLASRPMKTKNTCMNRGGHPLD
jgi:hypothetical protein